MLQSENLKFTFNTFNGAQALFSKMVKFRIEQFYINLNNITVIFINLFLKVFFNVLL